MSFRVLHVLDHSWPVLDGYSQRSRSIISAQAQNGMRPYVVTGPLHEIDDKTSADLTLDNVPYVRTPISHSLMARNIAGYWPFLREIAVIRLLQQRLASLLRHESFNIIHAHSPALCGLPALQMAKRLGIPMVYEIRCFWEDSHVNRPKGLHSSLRYHLGRRLETHVAGSADATVAIARPLLQDLEKRGIPSQKLFHIPNGVDVRNFVPRPRDESLASELGLNGLPTLGFIGTLFPWEGVAWMVRAAAEFHRRGSRFKLLIVGDGAETPELQKAIQETGSAKYISYIGRVAHEQVQRYYSIMDVMVYPRRSFRLTELVTPLKPLEAMALGKPVLGSNVGGLRELIEPETTGLLFEPGNIDDFCRQAKLLLEQPLMRQKLGRQGRENIIEEKDWKTIARRYEDVYKTAMRKTRMHS